MRRTHFAPDGTKLILKKVGETESCEGCYYYSRLYACYRTDSPFKDNCTGKWLLSNFIWEAETEE